MELLLVVFVVLGTAGLLLQGMMYTRQFHLKVGVRIINSVLGLLVAYLSFTSFPTGETLGKSVAATLGICAVVGFVVSVFKPDALAGRLLLTVSVLAGLSVLYIGI